MSKGGSFVGVLLVIAGILLAYLYSQGRLQAVWDAITNTTNTTTTATTPQTTYSGPATGSGSFGNYGTTSSAVVANPASPVSVAAPAIPSTTALSNYATIVANLGSYTSSAYPGVSVN